ncbi:hypothetical protein ACSQ67_004088 [Phaseolus vulgaris]
MRATSWRPIITYYGPQIRPNPRRMVRGRAFAKGCECGEGKEDCLDDNTNGEKEEGRADESEGSDKGNLAKAHMLMTSNAVNECLQVGGEERTLILDIRRKQPRRQHLYSATKTKAERAL